MTAPCTLALSLGLALALSQCRCVTACIGFFKDHSSRGHNTKISGNLPPHAMTLEQFIAANSRRGLTPAVLGARFRVADADGDGLLTPEEIESHRVTAAQNKQRGQAD